jgi:hypothetical protein
LYVALRVTLIGFAQSTTYYVRQVSCPTAANHTAILSRQRGILRLESEVMMAERGRDPHISAIEAIYGALKALDPATRRKVLASVSALIDVGEIPAGEQARSAVICVRIDQRRLNPGFMPTVRG